MPVVIKTMFPKEMYQREKNIFKKKCIAVRTMLFATLDCRLFSNEKAPLLIVVNAKNGSGNYGVPALV